MEYQEINAEEETAKELVEQDLQMIIGAVNLAEAALDRRLLDKISHTSDLKKIIDKRPAHLHFTEPYYKGSTWGDPPIPRTRSSSAFESDSQKKAHMQDFSNMVNG